MSTTPDSKSARHPKRKQESEDYSPTPTEMLRRLVICLRGFHLHREKPKITDWLTAGLTLVVAAAAICSAWVFQGQLTEARRATELTKTQWEAEHRPWMGLDGLDLTAVNFSSLRPSLISIHLEGTMVLRNFGTYPAFNAGANITQVFPLPTDAWTKDPLGKPPKTMILCSDQEQVLPGGEVVFPSRGFTHPFFNDMTWGWKGRNVEVPRVWLLVCVSYYDGRRKESHHTWIWLRSTHPLNAQWIILNPSSRYMPITGFESWGEEAD